MDKAGLAVHTAMSVDYAAWDQAGSNAEVATAILETADGGLAEIGDILGRMYELASEAASGSVTDTERDYLDAEYQQLLSQIDSIVASTTYFGTALLDGAYDQDFSVSADPSVTPISVDLTASAFDTTGLALAADLQSATSSATAQTEIAAAVTTISSGRATIGALMSQFDYASGNIETAKTNLESAMGVYMDADIAELSAEQTQLGVKMDSAIQALSVSNENLEKLSRLLS